MALKREKFGREITNPKREVEFTGEEIASFIQSQFTRVDNIENDKRRVYWEKNGRNGEAPKEIHTKVIVKPFIFGRDNRHRPASSRRESTTASDQMICYYISMSSAIRDSGSKGQIASIYNTNDDGVKIRSAYWQMLQTMVYKSEFRKLMLDDRENTAQWQKYGLGSKEARERFFALTKPHIIKGGESRIGILLNPDYIHRMIMVKWLMNDHPELNGTPFDVEILAVNNANTANWMDWKFRLMYVPRIDNDYDDTINARAVQDMIESINGIR